MTNVVSSKTKYRNHVLYFLDLLKPKDVLLPKHFISLYGSCCKPGSFDSFGVFLTINLRTKQIGFGGSIEILYILPEKSSLIFKLFCNGVAYDFYCEEDELKSYFNNKQIDSLLNGSIDWDFNNSLF